MTLLTTAALVLTLDLIGTSVFAISGAASGVKSRLDVFGVCVLAFVAANAGARRRRSPTASMLSPPRCWGC